ncbi:PKD domain-containing protein [Deinococcus soli (ex Cha et al. 2016)]|uniref:Uncharacterized protein YkwD n=2 Tax=Deinococcus soli (ex Cha et al. 2016) TaxID=1309411 RepID=A0AAE3XDZ7_9DEIO|nr:PKD domain-containing protein [Deinococcus soli (ex Cha et al. 2016)]MDR6218874.1 uncharacterized protein YkwD [Deinococcus soli (ex Cha et al. 2016)]MDR6328671.1 uncharacterized protein YkwD [Deinococcus soli (ex Cha et al. 2016)]MDR6751842.1 uncharacterized protein YkwD [Deinococcus soli (ex Cha et al. 2016)]
MAWHGRRLLVLACALLAAGVTAAHGQVPAEFKVDYQFARGGKAPLLVEFRTNAPRGYAVKWTFGDGATATGTKAAHVYYAPGVYPFAATLYDEAGRPVSRAQGEFVVKWNGEEELALTLVFGEGTVLLSSHGSVVYSNYPVTLTLDGKDVQALPLAVSPGVHEAQVRFTSAGGEVLSKTVEFTVRPAETDLTLEQRLIHLINNARLDGWDCAEQTGGHRPLPPLTPTVMNNMVARSRALDMAQGDFFKVVSDTDGSTALNTAGALGYQPEAIATTIAAGQRSAEEVMAAITKAGSFCDSLTGDYGSVGVAYVEQPDSRYGRYWTVVYTRP